MRKESPEKSLQENNNWMLSKVISGFKMINFETGPIIHVTPPLLFQESYREYRATAQHLKQLHNCLSSKYLSLPKVLGIFGIWSLSPNLINKCRDSQATGLQLFWVKVRSRNRHNKCFYSSYNHLQLSIVADVINPSPLFSNFLPIPFLPNY